MHFGHEIFDSKIIKKKTTIPSPPPKDGGVWGATLKKILLKALCRKTFLHYFLEQNVAESGKQTHYMIVLVQKRMGEKAGTKRGDGISGWSKQISLLKIKKSRWNPEKLSMLHLALVRCDKIYTSGIHGKNCCRPFLQTKITQQWPYQE